MRAEGGPNRSETRQRRRSVRQAGLRVGGTGVPSHPSLSAQTFIKKNIFPVPSEGEWAEYYRSVNRNGCEWGNK